MRHWTIAAGIALAASCVAAAPAHAARETVRIPGRYIVLYDGSVDGPGAATDRRERRDGFRAQLRYARAVKGFAARLSAAQVQRLKADPSVASVTPDRRVRALGTVAAGETVPAGLRRMQAATTTAARGAATVNVAVIDSGIDLDHADLNVAGGKNCVDGAAPPDDANGHGTHVAGTIGARNSGTGVVGVAPGTRLFAAKVLDADGGGTSSQVICGIDWVTSTRTDADPTNDIAVANMSLGGPGVPVEPCPALNDPEHHAICNSIAAGVTYVVAAGNDGWDFDYASVPDTPAAYGEVLTVTAVSDSDGHAGGTGGNPACRPSDADDRFATFSNFAATAAGRAHTIAGPGVCVLSTWPGGGHDTISGTSMAAPHIAGAVALCLGENGASGPCAGRSPTQIVARMRADAERLNTANPWFGFAGDPLHAPLSGRYYGFLPYAGTGAAPEPPPAAATPVQASPSGAAIVTGYLRAGTLGSLANDDADTVQLGSSGGTTAWYGSFTGAPSTLRDLRVTYKGRSSATCTQTVAIYRWADRTWVTLDSRNSTTTDNLLSGLVPSGTPAGYVSPTGELRVRVRCTRSLSSFTTSANLLRITYLR